MRDPTKVFALSKIFHERVRLGIMTVLVSKPEGIEFRELIKILKLTKGNLSVHVSKLEEAGYVDVQKDFVGKTPRTTYFATSLGERDFSAYLSILEDIIAQARTST